MLDILRKSLHFGIGAISMTREKAEQLVQEAVKKGEINSDEAKGLADQLVKKGEEERHHLTTTVKQEVKQMREEIGFVSQEKFKQLEERVLKMEQQLETMK